MRIVARRCAMLLGLMAVHSSWVVATEVERKEDTRPYWVVRQPLSEAIESAKGRCTEPLNKLFRCLPAKLGDVTLLQLIGWSGGNVNQSVGQIVRDQNLCGKYELDVNTNGVLKEFVNLESERLQGRSSKNGEKFFWNFNKFSAADVNQAMWELKMLLDAIAQSSGNYQVKQLETGTQVFSFPWEDKNFELNTPGRSLEDFRKQLPQICDLIEISRLALEHEEVKQGKMKDWVRTGFDDFVSERATWKLKKAQLQRRPEFLKKVEDAKKNGTALRTMVLAPDEWRNMIISTPTDGGTVEVNGETVHFDCMTTVRPLRYNDFVEWTVLFFLDEK